MFKFAAIGVFTLIIVLSCSTSSQVSDVTTTTMASNSTKDIRVNLEIVNDSEWDVTALFASPSDKSSWDGNLIDEWDIVTKGESVNIEFDAGTWDFKISAGGGNDFCLHDVEIEPGDYTLHLSDFGDSCVAE